MRDDGFKRKAVGSLVFFKSERCQFILLRPSKNKDIYVIECFPLTIPRQQNPIYTGEIHFYWKNERVYRPLKAIINNELIDDRAVTRLLQKARAVFLSEELSISARDDLSSYFRDLNIQTFLTVKLCFLCTLHSRTTVLKKEDVYYYQEGMHQICQQCALDELKLELSKRMEIVSSSVLKYAKLLLSRCRDVDKILRHLKSDSETLTDDLTLVKEIPVDEQSTKIRSISEYEDKLSPPLKKSLRDRGITNFLPVQVLAIEKGLLDGKSLLVVASTSAGKTLIGEIAAVNNIFYHQRKAVFCFPLVALANTKFREFQRHYPSLKLALRVGKSRLIEGLENEDELGSNSNSVPLKDADLIVATYEGLDVILRKNPKELGTVGTLIVDEIQTLEDPDRGPVLDGLITRIRVWSPNAQIIGLSATIGNPKALTSWLGDNFELVHLNWRPVPLEEHLILTREEEDKMRYLRELVEQETLVISSTGHRGQTIVFTNSRRKAHLISRKIRGSVVYHAGLPYGKRVRIEKGFERGKYSAVIATYALGAGVDFPASQVIFETLMMGNRRLTVNEFHQMLGRAGRLGKHDRGRIVLLASPDIQIEAKTELELAIELLNSKPLPVDPHHSLDSCAEQVLANSLLLGEESTIAIHQDILRSMVGVCPSLKDVLRLLASHKLVRLIRTVDTVSKRGIIKVKPTRLGKAVSMAFLPPSRFSEIREALTNRSIPIMVLATYLLPFEQVYLDDGLHSLLEKIYKMKMGHRFFDSQALDILSSKVKEKDGDVKLPPWVLDLFVRWSQTFFDCKCKENPYCEHPPRKLSRELLSLRVEKRMEPRRIAAWISSRYRLQIYAGDLFSWFDQLLFLMQGIIEIAHVLGEDVQDVRAFMQKIQNPYN